MIESGVAYTNTEIKDSHRLFVMCKFTISFGNEKFYVKSGFQFGLKNFQRWFCVIELRPINIKFCKQKNMLYYYENFINIKFTKQNIYE